MDHLSTNFDLHASLIPGQTTGMKVFHSPGITWVDSGLSCDTFNIIHITNGDSLTEQQLTETIDYYKSRDLAFCIWINEENLTGLIMDYFSGLSLSQQNMEPGMVLDMRSYQTIENNLHSNVRIVETQQDIDEYARVIAANWNPPDKNVIDYFKQTGAAILNKQNNILLAMYYDNNQPAAVVELFSSDLQTIGIYGLATREEWRGKGIGSALMTWSLNKIKELGYKHAILQASEDGIGIYQRLGFTVFTNYYEFA